MSASQENKHSLVFPGRSDISDITPTAFMSLTGWWFNPSNGATLEVEEVWRGDLEMTVWKQNEETGRKVRNNMGMEDTQMLE